MTAQEGVNLVLQIVIYPIVLAMWVEIRRLNRVVNKQAKIIGGLDQRLEDCLAKGARKDTPADWQQRQHDMDNREGLDRGNTPNPDES